MSKNPMMLLMVSAVLMLAAFGLYPAGAQEREHHGLSILTPANGAMVTGSVTVAYGFGGGDADRDREHRHHGGGMHVFLLVDQPTPEPGSTFQPDQNHVVFPEGQTQTTLTLAPGKHILQLAVVDHEGKVGRRFHGAESVSVIVQ